MSTPLNTHDYREAARKRLPRCVFDFVDGGAEDERCLDSNRAVFDALRLKPRRMTGGASCDLSVDVLGERLPTPVLIAPTGMSGLVRPNGDLALAHGAAAVGVPFVQSTASSNTIEEIAAQTGGKHWFQLYMVEPTQAEAMVERAAAAGITKLVITVDVPKHSKRERDLRNGFTVPMRVTPSLVADMAMHPRWVAGLLRHGMPQLGNFRAVGADGIEQQSAVMQRTMARCFIWEDFANIRRRWRGQILVKGIVRPEEAERCIAEGADGIILSNHGGRQLDSCVSPMEVLAECRSRIAAPILLDSGIRRGSDVVKALALGADAVLVGRATLYALAVDGAAGVEALLRILCAEIEDTLAQIGCDAVSDLSPDYIQGADALQVRSNALPLRMTNVA